MLNMKANIDSIKQWEQEFPPSLEVPGDKFYPVLCSDCFSDRGLRLASSRLGIALPEKCSNCQSINGVKLSEIRLKHLMYRYFACGSIVRSKYGGYPAFVANSMRPSSISSPRWLQKDLELLSEKTGWHVISYGPRAWMYGEIEPLKQMMKPETQIAIFERIALEYPIRSLAPSEMFYRMRLNLFDPAAPDQYDSPPLEYRGNGRLDSSDFPILYGSQDLQVCVHECRATADDEIYVATLQTTSPLQLLDLSSVLDQDRRVTEFESLDMAVHMLFLARSHSYPISRALMRFLRSKGFDGVFYPSYFSLLRTGARLFDTAFGISVRRIAQAHKQKYDHIVPNLALFGRPLAEEKISIVSIDKVLIERAHYDLNFGPVDVVDVSERP